MKYFIPEERNKRQFKEIRYKSQRDEYKYFALNMFFFGEWIDYCEVFCYTIYVSIKFGSDPSIV